MRRDEALTAPQIPRLIDSVPSEPERRLSAILSADVVGYSRLIAEDEDGTVRTLRAWRDQVSALISEHRGRLADFTGDNFLAEFPAALDAVECAIEIQRVLAARNTALPEDRRLRFRIGAHLGDVRREDGRLYGDGVNIAARLEGLAEPGGICVSAAVRDQVVRRLGLDFEDLGEQTVKNLPEPVRVFRLLERAEDRARATAASRAGTAAAGARNAEGMPEGRRLIRLAGAFVTISVVALALGAWFLRATVASRLPADATQEAISSGPPLTAIAVLPFDDLSPGGDHQWLADGMAEELIEMLSRSETLQVVARTSAHVAKETGGDVPAIGALLNVGTVVEGSVSRSGEQLRVIVQLIRVTDGYHLWSGRYDRRFDDVFAIQQEIGREISEALRAELGVAEDTPSWFRTARYTTRDVRAYELVKKAGDLLSEEASRRQGMNYCLEALEIDPDYAAAYACLGWGYYIPIWGSDRREEGTRERAIAAAQRALELEPTNTGAMTLLAELSMGVGDWESAKAGLESALVAAPGDGMLHQWYAMTLTSIGSLEQAAVEARRTADLDPLTAAPHFVLGNVHLAQRDYEAAAAAFEQSAQLGDRHALQCLPFAHHLNGMGSRALEAWIRLAAVEIPTGEMEKVLREAYARGGLASATGVYFEALVSRGGRPCTALAVNGARMLALIGDSDRMLACLDQSIEEHFVDWLAKVHPIYDPYRDDPRFQAYLRRIGL